LESRVVTDLDTQRTVTRKSQLSDMLVVTSTCKLIHEAQIDLYRDIAIDARSSPSGERKRSNVLIVICERCHRCARLHCA